MTRHHPDWIAPFVQGLERLELDKTSSVSAAMARDRAAVTAIASALEAGPLDAVGVTRLVAQFRELLGPALLEAERQRARTLHDLAPLFEHLTDATDAEWQVYLDVTLSARVRAMADMYATIRMNQPG